MKILRWLAVFCSIVAATVIIDPVLAQSNPFTVFGWGAGVDVNSGNKSANTLRVVLATDQPSPSNAFPISAASLPLPTGASTETTLGGVLTTSDFDTKAGSLTEAAPVTDTASSGLNGRLQRLAQRLTTLLAVFPTTIDTNSGNKSGSTLRVVLATDQPALTNKILVTPDSVALPANQSVNVAQMNGVTTSMNTGSPDTGTQRVVLADGALDCVVLSTASTNSTNCKASGGNFFGYDLYNTTTTVYYLRLYNTASAPTCSSATGFIRSIPVPPAAAAGQVSGGIRVMPIGVAYGTGVSYCLTGGSSSTDNTNAAAGIFGSVVYR